MRKLITRWAPLARGREAARSEVVRSVWVARAWVRRAGELTGHGDDLFFLALPEIYGLLGGERALLDQVPGRRAVYESYRALPSYPALIRGRFDPARWAADPRRRVDYYDGRAVAQAAPDPDAVITGFPGAAGVVEGTARVLSAPEDGAQLGDGEILVTTVTNIGWTPIFPRAARGRDRRRRAALARRDRGPRTRHPRRRRLRRRDRAVAQRRPGPGGRGRGHGRDPGPGMRASLVGTGLVEWPRDFSRQLIKPIIPPPCTVSTSPKSGWSLPYSGRAGFGGTQPGRSANARTQACANRTGGVF